MTDINSLENQLKEEFEMFSIAISRSDVMDKRKILPIYAPSRENMRDRLRVKSGLRMCESADIATGNSVMKLQFIS